MQSVHRSNQPKLSADVRCQSKNVKLGSHLRLGNLTPQQKVRQAIRKSPGIAVRVNAVSTTMPGKTTTGTPETASTATIVLSNKDNKGQVPCLDLTLVSAKDASLKVKFNTKDWKSSAAGEQMSGPVPPLPAGFGEPGAVLVKLREKQGFEGVTSFMRNGLEAGAQLVLPDQLEGPAKTIYNVLYSDRPVEKFLITSMELKLTTGNVNFTIDSIVDYKKGERIFFNAKPYLPQNTPAGVKALRQQELANLRGEDPATGKPTPAATQQRMAGDRIYDYDVYNDLGDATKPAEIRRILGGAPTPTTIPYPRRLRTGRAVIDGKYETRNLGEGNSDPWMPYDEQFRAVKQGGFLKTTLSTILSAVPGFVGAAFSQKPDIENFSSFSVVHALFEDDDDQNSRRQGLPFKFPGDAEKTEIDNQFAGMESTRRSLKLGKWPEPAVREDRSATWLTDREWARQTLAGQNPCQIEQVTAASVFLEATKFAEADKAGLLELPASIAELQKSGRLFGVDQTAYMTYISKINSQPGTKRCQYAGKALMYLSANNVLLPAAIELWNEVAPGKIESRLYYPGMGAEEWFAARTVFASLDSGEHQLVSHWLRAHACTEPYAIAMHRTLSAVHPVYKLMLPHFRYTISINGQARQGLINVGGTIEKCFTPGKFAMELSAAVYDAGWTFEGQDLENNLLVRNMLKVDDKGNPIRTKDGHVEPVIEYPYATDGLDIYYAYKAYFAEYLGLYYDDAGSNGKSKVTEDPELMAWWKEVKEKGHPDKKTGWPELKDINSLVNILTTIAWTTSAHHAAVNFGQYMYSAWMPNRPSYVRKAIPTEGPDLEELKCDYEKAVLEIVSDPKNSLQVLIALKLLSTHSADEQYISDKNPLITDPAALAIQDRYIAILQKIEADIEARNQPGASKVRSKGGVSLPYTLMTPCPKVRDGLTGTGVPTSVSI